jgi:hypothetical protein
MIRKVAKKVAKKFFPKNKDCSRSLNNSATLEEHVLDTNAGKQLS